MDASESVRAEPARTSRDPRRAWRDVDVAGRDCAWRAPDSIAASLLRRRSRGASWWHEVEKLA